MDIENGVKNLEGFIKTKNGTRLTGVLAACFHASIFGTLLAAIVFFALMLSFPDINNYVAFFLSIPAGWLIVFFLSYFLTTAEIKNEIRKKLSITGEE